MRSQEFGRTGRQVSEIGFGAWAIGSSWGEVSEGDAVAALNTALDAGITFIDTADVYGDGRSEKLIAQVLRQRGGPRPFIATKAGRRLNPHVAGGYTAEALAGFVDRSRDYLEMETLDLLQLHCPPTDVYYHPEVFAALDDLVAAGRIAHYGVSVERIEEALKSLEYPGVASIQIIFNIFRQRPAERLFARALETRTAIIARVPLASGLLTGKMRPDTSFDSSDHRLFNRHGEFFDVGETFAGVPYGQGLKAVERIRPLVGADTTMAKFALKWILMFDAVTVAIPGAKNAAQALANAEAATLPPLDPETMAALKAIYDEDIRPHVHQRW